MALGSIMRFLDPGWGAPGVSVVTITPADADLAEDVRALWIGATAGVVYVTCPDGSTAIFPVAANSLLPVMCRRVGASTTAATIIGLK